jgi:hypothetical protein
VPMLPLIWQGADTSAVLLAHMQEAILAVRQHQAALKAKVAQLEREAQQALDAAAAKLVRRRASLLQLPQIKAALQGVAG